MKANELMIDDWVYNKNIDEPIQVYPVMFSQMFRSNPNATTEDYNIFPVPLTAEILEKNGFVWDNLPMEQYWEQYGLIIYPAGGGYRMNCGQNVSFKIDSVHELQHLLRLCGIDKEIVV